MAGHTVQEEWRPVLGFDGRYEVSNLGRVRGRRGILNPGKDRLGYLLVYLWDGKVSRRTLLHRLVASAFLAADPARPDCHHKDENPSNARLDNLMWVTHAENMAFTKQNRLGQGSHLSEDQVRQIRKRAEAGERYADIGRDFGVSKHAVCDIKLKRNWAHIE